MTPARDVAFRAAFRAKPGPSGGPPGYTPRMTAKTLAALIALSLLLAGCGNKGPLVLPSAPMSEETLPDAPADEAPAARGADAATGEDAGDARQDDASDVDVDVDDADADAPPPLPGA